MVEGVTAGRNHGLWIIAGLALLCALYGAAGYVMAGWTATAHPARSAAAQHGAASSLVLVAASLAVLLVAAVMLLRGRARST